MIDRDALCERYRIQRRLAEAKGDLMAAAQIAQLQRAAAFDPTTT